LRRLTALPISLLAALTGVVWPLHAPGQPVLGVADAVAGIVGHVRWPGGARAVQLCVSNTSLHAADLGRLHEEVPPGRLLPVRTLPAGTELPGGCDAIYLGSGPGAEAALAQAEAVRRLGGHAVEAPGLDPAALSRLSGFSGALYWGTEPRAHAQALAQRRGPILPLIGGMPDLAHVVLERHVCIDTTASGGNAQLLAQVAEG